MFSQSKQGSGHPLGTARNAPMLPLVFGQIAAFDGAGQRRRLSERQAKTFASHCIH